MKPCDDRWREELVQHTLGSPAAPALAEHLEKCAVCAATLRDWKARMGQIDAGIRQLAGVEPSDQAIQHLVNAVRAPRKRLWRADWKWATAALAGLAVIIVASSYVWRAHQQFKENARALSAASAIGSWSSPTAGLLRSPAERWMKSPPQLGHYFYPLSTEVPKKESENP